MDVPSWSHQCPYNTMFAMSRVKFRAVQELHCVIWSMPWKTTHNLHTVIAMYMLYTKYEYVITHRHTCMPQCPNYFEFCAKLVFWLARGIFQVRDFWSFQISGRLDWFLLISLPFHCGSSFLCHATEIDRLVDASVSNPLVQIYMI